MWQALVEVVRSFNDKDRPGYAIAALFVIVLTALGIAGLASLGAISLGEAIKFLQRP
jgi:hypothetical protein